MGKLTDSLAKARALLDDDLDEALLRAGVDLGCEGCCEWFFRGANAEGEPHCRLRPAWNGPDTPEGIHSLDERRDVRSTPWLEAKVRDATAAMADQVPESTAQQAKSLQETMGPVAVAAFMAAMGAVVATVPLRDAFAFVDEILESNDDKEFGPAAQRLAQEVGGVTVNMLAQFLDPAREAGVPAAPIRSTLTAMLRCWGLLV